MPVDDIPMYGLGTWKIPQDRTAEVVYRSIAEHGVRHLDCASDYGNEVEVGQGIARAISEGIVTREDLWITSKLWNTYHRAENVLPACQRSLHDMQLTYFDLYLVHFPIALKYVPIEARYPPGWLFDPSAPDAKVELDLKAPMHATWAAMEALVSSGVSKRIGVSNFSVQLLMDLLAYAVIPPFCNQIELHPYNTQVALRETCQRYGVKVVAFSPLASASYVEMGTDAGLRLLEEPAVLAIGAAHGKTAAQAILRWNLQQDVVVIPKSVSLAHLAENLNVFDFTLTNEEMATIGAFNCKKRFNDPGIYGRFMGMPMPIFD